MIAIPNMEKPKSCGECRFHRYDWGNEYIPSADRCSALLIRFNEISVDVHTSKETLPDCPIIDIVTCGECKYSDIIESTGQTECLAKRGYWFIVDPTDFCSYGERRSDERTTE